MTEAGTEIGGEWFRNVHARDVVVRGGWFEDVDIDAELRNVVVNGVDIGPLVEAELVRRDPDRRLIRPTDADGYRACWEMHERRWAAAVERARALPEELLHERVDKEWSFIETLRHLVMATDAWVLRVVLGDPYPFWPLGLPHDEMGDVPGVPNDRSARPALDVVLAARADRMATVRRVLGSLTDADIDRMTEPVTEPGYPASESFLVSRALGAIMVEEWLHREYAERDLAVLEARR